MRPFYIVSCKGNEVPINGRYFHHHMSETAAKNEAMRLSRRFPDKSFRVLKAIGQAKNGGYWADAESNYLQ